MKHILIVDDERLIRYSLSTVFKATDTEVVTAGSGHEALEACKGGAFDFCFLDMQLPDINGIEVMRTMKRLSPAARIIIMTGSEVGEKTMKAIREHAFLFLKKPFDLFGVKRVLDALPPEQENVFQEFAALEAVLSADRRSGPRRAAAEQTAYVTSQGGGEEHNPLTADVIDISDAGTRIRTEYRLQPESMIRFKNSVHDAEGIVRWSTSERDNLYLAGIQFVTPDHG